MKPSKTIVQVPSSKTSTQLVATMSPDVSVIVPCYNVEATVEQCVLSVEKNNRIGMEILCVDDGSTDATSQKLAELAQDDARLRTITKTNGGYGSAVNRGLSEARGTYIAIAEPDDYVAPHMYDELFAFAQELGCPDVVKSSYWRVITQEDGSETLRHNDYFHAITPATQPFTIDEQPQLLRYHPSIWSALYRRSFLEELGIRFMEAPGAGWVDNPFSVEVLLQAAAIGYTDTPYYHYREDLPGSSSVTLPWQTQFERWHDMMDVLDRLKISNRAISEALAVVGFRYVEKALAQLPNENAVREGARAIFMRMDPDLIAGLHRVSPALRALAFRLRGQEPPPFDSLAYARSLVDAGFHSLEINGVGFTMDYLGRYTKALAARLDISRS